MATSAFRNPRALMTGAAIGLCLCLGSFGYYALRGPEYAEARPGSVMVRPIIKDNSVKRATKSILLGVFGFAFGTYWAGKRQAKRKGE